MFRVWAFRGIGVKGFRGFGARVSGSGFRVWGLGFMVQGLWFRVYGSGFRVLGWFKVQLGSRV